MYLSLNRRLLALRFRSNFQAEKWDRAVQEHEEMIKALESRDGSRLGSILREHLLEKRDAVLKDMAASGEAAARTTLAATAP
jgi:DNA-binding GntR family transcriptional regulator